MLCFGFDVNLDFEIQVSTDSTASLSGCCWDGTCCSSLWWISATTVTVSFCLFSAGPTLFCLVFSRTLFWGFTCFFVWKGSVRLRRPWLVYDTVMLHSQSRKQACPFTSILRNRLPTRSFKTLSPSFISTSSDIHSHLQRFGQPWLSNFSPQFTMWYNPAIFANAKPRDPEAAELKTVSLYFCPH